MILEFNASFRRPGFELVAELKLGEPRFVALVGPSGSGKTTLLRSIAGFERLAHTRVRFRGRVWQDERTFVPPHHRPIGYVFQEASLFPHLTVGGNLEYARKRARRTQSDGRDALDFQEVVALLGIQHLIARSSAVLSGGERQRVAIARTLLTNPAILLLDEPLSSLDVESRTHIMPYLTAVQSRFHLPVLYVTHTPSEMVQLADEVIYLQAGHLLAHGPINQLLTDPTLPLCRMEEAGAALNASVIQLEPEFHLMHLRLADAVFAVSASGAKVHDKVRIYVRARDVGLALTAPHQTSVRNVVEGQVIDIHPERDPAHRLVRVAVGGHTLLSRVTAKAAAQLALRSGQTVYAQVKSVALTR